MDAASDTLQLFRVWVIRYQDWRPTRWDDWPPESRVVEPVVDADLTWDQACAVVAGFNNAMLIGEEPIHERQSIERLWAVATPVVLRREGQLTAGETLRSTLAVDP